MEERIDDLRSFVTIADAAHVPAGARRNCISAATARPYVPKLDAALAPTRFLGVGRSV